MVFPQNKKILLIFAVDSPLNLSKKKKKKKKLVQNECNRPIGRLRSVVGRVAWWLATCARKPKVPGSSPAASYVQR